MIVVEDLRKSFGRLDVLQGVTFQVPRGEFLVVLGPSGSGKSTLLRCLNGLVTPTAGTVAVEGVTLGKRHLREVRKRVGFVFQGFHLLGNVSVLGNVLIGRLADKPPWGVLFSRRDREIALEALEAVGLADRAGARADTLSGGQMQRVAIARALAHDPEVLLADEPVSNLDPVIGREILALLRRINRERGTTVICNLHSPDDAARHADRVVGLRAGRICFDGPPARLSPAELSRIYGDRDRGPGATDEASPRVEVPSC